jgi:uncharacterized protein (DUF2336 family)
MTEQPLDLIRAAVPARRQELLSVATEVYARTEHPSEAARRDYSAIAQHALARLGTAERAAYARRVAALPTLPRPVARRLAEDEEVEIAGVVLRLSPVLTDEDLAEIAVTCSQDHLIAMAERSAISEIATEVMLDRGGDAVLRRLAMHSGARFTPGARERLSQRVLRIAVEAADQKNSVRVRAARDRIGEVRTLIADVEAHRKQLDEVISQIASQDRAVDLATILAAFAQRSIADALQALFGPDHTSIEAWADDLGLAPPTRAQIVQMRTARLNQRNQPSDENT